MEYYNNLYVFSICAVAGNGTPITNVGLTLANDEEDARQRALTLAVNRWPSAYGHFAAVERLADLIELVGGQDE